MKTVLIVDDAPSVLAALTHLFKLRRYTVLAASNGFEALTLAAAHTFDAALVDVNMPGMDGYAVCRKLCEQTKAGGRTVPVLMMTGCYSTAGANLAAAAGAVALLRKPFDIFALLKTVDALLAPRGDAEPTASDEPVPGAPVRDLHGRDTPSIFGFGPAAVTERPETPHGSEDHGGAACLCTGRSLAPAALMATRHLDRD
jgi:DNA-binding response OmpR family regulator